jgi:hypothetical protein
VPPKNKNKERKREKGGRDRETNGREREEGMEGRKEGRKGGRNPMPLAVPPTLPLHSPSLPFPWTLSTSNLLSAPVVSLFCMFYVNGIAHHVTPCDRAVFCFYLPSQPDRQKASGKLERWIISCGVAFPGH